MLTRTERMAKVIEHSRTDLADVDPRFHEVRRAILALDGRLNGNRSKAEPGEKYPPTVGDRLSSVARGVDHSTYGPTPTHRESLRIAVSEMGELRQELEARRTDMTRMVQELIEAGAPWIEGEPLP